MFIKKSFALRRPPKRPLNACVMVPIHVKQQAMLVITCCCGIEAQKKTVQWRASPEELNALRY